MKKVIISLACVILLASCSQPYVISDNRIVIEDEKNGSVSSELSLEYLLKADIFYPSLAPENSEEIANINHLLRYAAFDLFGYGYFDTIKMQKGELEPISGWAHELIESNYEILFFDENYVSVLFDGRTEDGWRVYLQKSAITLNIKTGKIVSSEEILSLEQVIERINDGEYEIFEGGYYGGWEGHEQYIKEAFIEIIEFELHRGLSDDTDRLVDTGSIYNFGLTEDKLLLKIWFEDSLNGYVVLEFEREDT